MVQKLQFGIRTWLLCLSLLASAPLLLFAIYSINDLRQAERASVTQRLVLRGEAAANGVAQRLGGSLGFLNALATTNAAKRGDLPALYEHARQAIRLNRDSTAISLVDRQERLLFLTLSPYGTQGLPVSDVDSVRKVFQTGKPSISRPFKSPVRDLLVVAMGVPVFVGEEVAYCLRLIIPVNILGAILVEQRLADGWISALIGESDILLARSRDADRFVGQRASSNLVAALAQPHGAVFESETLDGVPVLTTVAPVPSSTSLATRTA
jgi:hypothetical protein